MAYIPDNLSLADTSIGGYQPRYWHYTTAADADATIVGAGYFADGVTKGMKVGDIVDVVATTGPKYKRYQCSAVSGAAATVTAPVAIT